MDLTTIRNLIPLVLLYAAFFCVASTTGIWSYTSIRNSVALIIGYVLTLLISKVFTPYGKVG